MRSFLAFLLLIAPVALAAQNTPVIAVHSGPPGGDIYTLPPTMLLIPTAPGAHPGKVWVRSSDEGLNIWGRVQVDDDDLHWPKQKSEMLSSDHIELWLSASPEVEMPAI